MTRSLTDSLRDNRLTVVSVDPIARRLRVRGGSDQCTEIGCGDRTLVVADDTRDGGLETLNPGDIVKMEGAPGLPTRIVVLRRVWEELGSPEV